MIKKLTEKKRERLVFDCIERIVGNERFDMIGENDWDRIDDEILRYKYTKKLSNFEIFKLRKLLKKIKDQWTI